MATANIKAVITADDQASAVVSKFGKNAEKSSLGVGIAVAAIGAATVAYGVQSVKAFGESERASKQLEHAVVDVSHATREQLKQTEDLAVALSKKGVLDDDAIKAGLAQLSTFGLSNKAVQNLGGSLADLAVNQYGVNASNEQLSDTANMVAKALNGQFGILEKSGIRFTEAQKAIIEFGTEEQKVQAINEGFAQNLKYTNDIASQTAEGAFARLNVQLGNLQEKIGETISTALVPLVTKLGEWIEKNPELTEKLLLLGLVLGTVTVALWGVNTVVNILSTSVSIFNGVLNTAFGRLGILIGAIVGVYYWFQSLANIVNYGTNIIAGFNQRLLDNIYRVQQAGGWIGNLAGFFLRLTHIIYGAALAIDNLLHKIPILGSILPRMPQLNIPGFATGVQNFGGGLAVVGERGPELVNLPRGSDVIPNNQIGSSSSGSTTININIGLMTGSAIERREAAMKMFEDLQDIASMQGQTVGQLIGA